MNFKEFKENMENPRFKAAVYLGGYLLLGFVLVMLARDRASTYEPITPEEPNTEIPSEKTEKLDKDLLSNFRNYAYEITLNHVVDDILTTYFIEGLRYNNEELFTYPVEVDAYYVKDNQYYQVFDQRIKPVAEKLFPVDLTKLKPENLSFMLNNLTPTLENTIDGVKTSTYYIPFETFIYYYNGTEIKINPDKQITPLTLKLEIATKDEIIQKIEFDLTNFVNQKEFTIEKLVYLCEFSNQNAIEDFNVDFIEE